MRIIVDSFGGDNAPDDIIKGAFNARDKRRDLEIILCGDEERIEECIEKNALSGDYRIVNAKSTVEMNDSPSCVLNEKKDSSMAVGLWELKNGHADAFVSAGSTGALTVGATFIVKRISGIKRPALACIMPSYTKPFMMMDIGANAECRSQQLVQFAYMADIYLRNVIGLKEPEICLANIGTEENKGTDTVIEAYKALSAEKDLNFCGNIEARDIPFGKCDAVICDGFTGNMLLKMYEGTAQAMMKSLKDIFTTNFITKLSSLSVKKQLYRFKQKMDYREFGGAPIMGVAKPVIKAHGSSDEKAFCSAVLQAADCCESGMIDSIRCFAESKNIII